MNDVRNKAMTLEQLEKIFDDYFKEEEVMAISKVDRSFKAFEESLEISHKTDRHRGYLFISEIFKGLNSRERDELCKKIQDKHSGKCRVGGDDLAWSSGMVNFTMGDSESAMGLLMSQVTWIFFKKLPNLSGAALAASIFCAKNVKSISTRSELFVLAEGLSEMDIKKLANSAKKMRRRL
jgi:hypothetical protein